MVVQQKLVGLGQSIAQLKEEFAQIGVRLFFAGIGPELKGDMLPRLGRLAMQQQIGQQRLQARRVDARDRFCIIAQAKVTQQVNMEGRQKCT
jgi:hypothetical protein